MGADEKGMKGGGVLRSEDCGRNADGRGVKRRGGCLDVGVGRR